jgi:hypothetical protein
MRYPSLVPALLVLAACGDVEHADHDHEGEFITDVELTFQREGSADIVATWSDPEADGDPVVTPIVLADASASAEHVAATYTVSVKFLNTLEDPAEDLTPEIEDESDQHQVFFTGTAVAGPATGENGSAVVAHAYADTDAAGLPVGLSNTFSTLSLGAGELTVTLRHLPPENDTPLKVEGLAENVAESGFSGIGGDSDAQVTFELSVE